VTRNPIEIVGVLHRVNVIYVSRGVGGQIPNLGSFDRWLIPWLFDWAELVESGWLAVRQEVHLANGLPLPFSVIHEAEVTLMSG